MKKEKPTELWILIFFIIIYVITQLILVRYYILHPNTLYSNAKYECLIAAIIGIILIYGLLKRFKWAWYITVLSFCIQLIISVYYFIYIPSNIYSVLIIAAGLYLLFRPVVKNYFMKENKLKD